MSQTVFCGRDRDLDHLKEAWRVVHEENRPQIVVLLAESGLGKTRLVQEFYAWLAHSYRSDRSAGYWPPQLSQNEQNLVVNPNLASVDTDQVMPFLWWALRLIDPSGRNQVLSSAVGTFLKALTPHLQAMYRARRQKQRWLEGGRIAGSVALEFIPLVGGLIAAGEAVFELEKLRRESRSDRSLSPDHADQQAVKDINERILSDLGQLFQTGQHMASIPMVWVVDDAHFSPTDPGVVDLFADLIQRAQRSGWPLLVIVTHWEQEWHEQLGGDGPASIAGSLVEHYQRLHPDWQPRVLLPILDGELAPVLEASLPGLTAAQAGQLLARTDGNPRFLDEIVRLCLGRPRYFVERRPENPLSDKGLRSVLAESTSLHDLVEARLNDIPAEVRNLVTLSSLQGMRLLHLVSQHLMERLIAEGYDLEASQDREALELANTPYAFINILDHHLAEFSQRVFYEVAKDGVEDIVDQDEALDALRKVLTHLNRSHLDDLSEDEQGLLLQLIAEVLAQSEKPADRHRALRANAMLLERALGRYDYRVALQLADRMLAGAKQDSWQLKTLTFNQLWAIHIAFRHMEWLADAQTVAVAMNGVAESSGNRRDLGVARNLLADLDLIHGDVEAALEGYRAGLGIHRELAESLGTSEAKRDLSVSLNRVGDVLRDRGKLSAALECYQESLDIREELAKGGGALTLKRDVILSSSSIAGIHHARGDLDAALERYQTNLGIAQELATALGTPDSERDVVISRNKLGTLLLAKGELQTAFDQYSAGLAITRELAERLGTPDAKRDLSASLNHVGDIYRDREALDTALEYYQESLSIRRELVETVGTPEAKRDLTVPLDRVGGIYRLRKEYAAALEYYQTSLDITLELIEILDTTDLKRDLVVSYNKISLVYAGMGSIAEVRRTLNLGLSAAQEYRQLMPYQDAETLLTWFQEFLEKVK